MGKVEQGELTPDSPLSDANTAAVGRHVSPLMNTTAARTVLHVAFIHLFFFRALRNDETARVRLRASHTEACTSDTGSTCRRVSFQCGVQFATSPVQARKG